MKITPVFFHRYKNLVSKGIRFFTNSWYNHCGFLFEFNGLEMFMEAVESGVIIMSKQEMLDKYANICEIVYLDKVEAKNNPLKYVNCKYQFSVFGTFVAYSTVCYLFGKDNFLANKVSNKEEPTKFFCFELLGTVMGLSHAWTLTGRDFIKLDKNKVSFV